MKFEYDAEADPQSPISVSVTVAGRSTPFPHGTYAEHLNLDPGGDITHEMSGCGGTVTVNDGDQTQTWDDSRVHFGQYEPKRTAFGGGTWLPPEIYVDVLAAQAPCVSGRWQPITEPGVTTHPDIAKNEPPPRKQVVFQTPWGVVSGVVTNVVEDKAAHTTILTVQTRPGVGTAEYLGVNG